jgi:hypothetical protein
MAASALEAALARTGEACPVAQGIAELAQELNVRRLLKRYISSVAVRVQRGRFALDCILHCCAVKLPSEASATASRRLFGVFVSESTRHNCCNCIFILFSYSLLCKYSAVTCCHGIR